MNEISVAMKGICKDFGPVRVLFDVDFSVKKGEVHALLGENGAGKSTLMKILGGYLQPTEGTIELFGEEVQLTDSGRAEDLGVVLIHQEFNLAEDLTVEQNIFLGREIRKGLFVDQQEMQERCRQALLELESAHIDPRSRVKDLSVSEKQMVEITKAMSRNTKVLILDEPTAVLTGSETAVLFKLIRRLKSQGVSIIYISHKLDEVKEISDRLTVLRDGRLITVRNTSDTTQDEMANLMVGRELVDMYPDKAENISDEVVFAAEGVSVPKFCEDCSFELRRGEVLGFAGLVGSGRTELMEGILGLKPRTSGKIYRNGEEVQIRKVADGLKYGIAYLSEDRKGKGLHIEMTLMPNVTLLALKKFCKGLFLDKKLEEEALKQAIVDFEIKVPHLNTRVNTLSGGNQQKIALGKIMQVDPEIVILDEPTRGIDVGTKQQIYYFVRELTKQGKSVILISSEMQEIIGLSDRVAVMFDGRITGVLSGDDINEETIVRYATGLEGVKQHAAKTG